MMRTYINIHTGAVQERFLLIDTHSPILPWRLDVHAIAFASKQFTVQAFDHILELLCEQQEDDYISYSLPRISNTLK